MTDPWEDVREEIERAELDSLDAEDWAAVYSKDCTRLLAENAALLAVVEELAPHAKDRYVDDFGDWYDDDFWREWLERNYPALAALPEHLRE